MANQNKTIAFRLHDSLAARLAIQATERQMSIGELSRQIVIEHLSNTSQVKMTEGLARLENQLRLATLTLLCDAGHAEPAEALDWVRSHLGPVNPIEGGTTH